MTTAKIAKPKKIHQLTPKAKLVDHTPKDALSAIVVLDMYYDWNDFREKPVSANYMKRIATELIQWCKENPRAYKISPFFKSRGIDSKTVQRWRDRFPEFQEAYSHSKEIIGDRREELMFEGKLREKPVMFGQGQFCPEWRRQEIENREALKDREHEGTQFIVLKSFDEEAKVIDV